MNFRCLLAAFAIAALVQPEMSAAQPRAAAVVVDRVEREAIADTTAVIGQLVASVETEVAARRSGVAGEVLFAIGERVEKGAPLVRLETTLTEIEKRSAEAQLETAQAGVEAASAQLTMAQLGLERQARLEGSTAFSRAQFETLEQEAAMARGELARASAQVGAARAAMARVEYDLTNAEIVAPFTGVVTERMAQPGQYVRLGDPIARLLDAERLEIEADVPAELISGLPPGAEVKVVFGGDVSAKAVVRTVLPLETIATRTRPVRFLADLSSVDPLRVAVGKSVTLQIPVSAPRDATTVPKDALVQGRGGSWIVFVVEDGAAQPRPVRLGAAAGSRMEVLEGLAPGELVVVRGNERLTPGQPVTANELGG